MNETIRKVWAEKTFELMNIGAGALLFGQAFAGHDFFIPIAIMGLVLFISGYVFSYFLLRKKRR